MMLSLDSEPYWMQDVRLAQHRLEMWRAALREAQELAAGDPEPEGRPKTSDQASPEDISEST